MASGGARTRSSYAPKPGSLERQYDAREWVRLPKSGCDLPVPNWPSSFEPPDASELALWHDLWRRPQAYVWHNDGIIHLVVVYVRRIIDASSKLEPPASALTAIRQLAEQLLLSTPALRAARYFIQGGPEEEFFRTVEDGTAPRSRTAHQPAGAAVVRGRFRTVTPKADDDDTDGSSSSDE
jgi:hypothetical protein